MNTLLVISVLGLLLVSLTDVSVRYRDNLRGGSTLTINVTEKPHD